MKPLLKMGPHLSSSEVYVTASGTNPFDRSYNEIQSQFDEAIIQLLSEMGNLTIKVVRNKLISNLKEYELDPNAWIVEQLVNGSCDISSSTMVLTPEASRSALYTLGVGYFRPQLFYRAKSIREESNIYYMPFSSEVWICLFGLLLTITVALTFILGRETKLPHDTPYDIIARIADEQHDEGLEWNGITEIPSKESLLQRERWEISEILLVAIGALGQQGSARDPSTSAARMLLLVMLLLAALAYTAYSASVISLVSLLPSAEKEESALTKNVPINKRISIHDTNFFKHSFKSSFRDVDYNEIHAGLEDAVNGKALFIGDKDVSLTYILGKGYGAELRCSLARVFLGIDYQRVFAIRKSSGLQEPINRNLIRLQQYGFLSQTKKKFFDVRYPCSFKERSSVSGFVSFNSSDIKPALYILGSGLLVSVLLLFLEMLVSSSSKIIRKMFIIRWTANDRQVNDLALNALKLNKAKAPIKPCSKKNRDKNYPSLILKTENDFTQNRLPFIT